MELSLLSLPLRIRIRRRFLSGQGLFRRPVLSGPATLLLRWLQRRRHSGGRHRVRVNHAPATAASVVIVVVVVVRWQQAIGWRGTGGCGGAGAGGGGGRGVMEVRVELL